MTLLELSALEKRFGGVKALDGVDLDVRPGEIHGLIGPNGSGKSTCLNVVSGLYRPTAGHIRFGGREIGRLPAHAIARAGVARTFQNIRLFRQLTAVENVMVAAEVAAPYRLGACLWRGPRVRRGERAARARACELLERVGLADVGGVAAGSLPYGRQRMLEIARALATEPQILLLDEPAAGLNDAETAALATTMRSLHSDGLTLLLIDHKMSLVLGICDRVTVLDFGRRIAHGTPDEVRNDPLVIEAYLGEAPEDGGGPSPS